MKNNMCIRLLNEWEVAEILGLAVQTLRNWRFENRGPHYCKIGRSVRYKAEDIDGFIESSRVETEAGTTKSHGQSGLGNP